jgi:hypothetical protein
MRPTPRFAPWLAAAMLAIAANAPHAFATQVRHLDMRELSQSSSDIVIGRVERVASRWNESKTKIFTDVTVRVSQSLKGADGAVTFSQLGGTVGDLRQEVHGCPAFTAGEEAVLFLWRDAKGRAQLNGLGQGKFEIRRDAGGRALVQRHVEGLAVREARLLRSVPAGNSAPGVPLEELVTEIRTVLAEGGR